MIYGTNLLTRSPVPVPVFCYLFVSEKLFGKVSRNQLKIYVNCFHKGIRMEPGVELQGGTAPRRHLGAAHPLAAPGAHPTPSDVFSSCPFTNKLTSTRKPSISDYILQKTSEAAAVANPKKGNNGQPTLLGHSRREDPMRGPIEGGAGGPNRAHGQGGRPHPSSTFSFSPTWGS